jgi:hypothetical protein
MYIIWNDLITKPVLGIYNISIKAQNASKLTVTAAPVDQVQHFLLGLRTESLRED